MSSSVRCHAARDGECSWGACPQNHEGEPARSGRHCPYDIACSDPGCDAPDNIVSAISAFVGSTEAQFVLGLPNFTFIKHAQLWRLTGAEIAAKAEAEQAFFLALLLRLVADNPVTWRVAWAAEVQQRQARLEAQTNSPPEAQAAEDRS